MANRYEVYDGESTAGVDESPSWGDYFNTMVKIGGTEVLSALPAAARYIGEKFGDEMMAAGATSAEHVLNNISEDAYKALSPAMKSRLSAPLTSTEFWSHPFSSTMAKTTRMAPSMVAAAASLVTGTPAWLALGLSSGGLSAAQTIDDAYKELDGMTDPELIHASDYYAGLRDKGLSQDEARKDIADLLLGAKPAMLFALGAVTGNIGVPGQFARAIGVHGAGAAVEGTWGKRFLKGALAGGGTEAAQSAAETGTIEVGNVQAGLQDEVNTGNIVNAALEGGALGGLLGGVTDAFGGHKTTKSGALEVPSKQPPPAVPPPLTPVAVSTAPVSPGATPTPSDTVGAPSKKTRYPKKPVAPAEQQGVTVGGLTDATAPDVAVALEASKKTPVQVAPAPVEAPAPAQGGPVGAETVPAPAPVAQSPEAAPEPSSGPAPVTPEVTPATSGVPDEINYWRDRRQKAAIRVNEAKDSKDPVAIKAAGEEFFSAMEGLRKVDPTTFDHFMKTNPANRRVYNSFMRPLKPEETKVTPEVTPAPVVAGPEMGTPPANPLETAPRRGSRVLQDAANAETKKRIATSVKENVKALKDEGAISTTSEGSITLDEVAPVDKEAIKKAENDKKWNAQKRKRAEDTNKAAGVLFDEVVPDKPTVPKDEAGTKELFDRVEKAVSEVEKAGITIPDNFKDNTLYNDRTLWLMEARDFVRSVPRKSGKLPSQEAVLRFVDRSAAIKDGKFAEALSERRAEGDIAKRGGQRAVTEIAAPFVVSETQVDENGSVQGGEDAVVTSVSKSANAAREDTASTPEAPKVGKDKNIELTDAEKAAAAASLAKAEAKGGPKTPAAKPAEKIAAIKEKAAAKAEVEGGEGFIPLGQPRFVRAIKFRGRIYKGTGADDHIEVLHKISEKLNLSLHDLDIALADPNEKDFGIWDYPKDEFISMDEYDSRRKGSRSVAKPSEKIAEIKEKAKTPSAIGKAKAAEKAKPKVEHTSKVSEAITKAKKETNASVDDGNTNENDDENTVEIIRRKKPTGKAKLKEELSKVETKPTDAQKEAGNFAKAHVNIEGHPIAVETRKGSRREGVGPDGKPWSVIMPSHYGHILGTEGADGKPVDVFLGPKGWPRNPLLKNMQVFVIDQTNLDGTFDEHKAFIGFDDARHATETYNKAFENGADGRVGDFRVFSPDEFKAWLEARKKQTKPAGEDVQAILAETPNARERGPVHEALHQIERDESSSTAQFTSEVNEGFKRNGYEGIAEVLERWATTHGDYDTFSGNSYEQIKDYEKEAGELNSKDRIAITVLPKILNRLREINANVRVFVLPQELIHTLSPKALGAFYAQGNYIVMNEQTFFHGGIEGARTYIHEGVHAAFMNVFWHAPMARTIVDRIAKELVKAGDRNGQNFREHYAFIDADEFLAEAFSNPSMQEELARTPVSAELARLVNASKNHKSEFVSLWDTFTTLVRKVLGLFRPQQSLLDAVMSVGASLDEIQQTHGLQGPMSEASTGRKDFETLSKRKRDDLPWRKQADVNDAQNRILTQVDEWLHGERQNKLSPMLLLATRSTDHIARAADRLWGAGKLNPIRKIADIIEMTRHKAEEYFRGTLPLIKEFDVLERKFAGPVWQSFSELLRAETEAGVFIDRPLDQQPHLGKNRMDKVWSKAQHADLAAQYALLPPELKALRLKALEFFPKRQNEMSLAIINNMLLKGANVKDAGLAQRLHEGNTTAADEALIGPELLDAIKDAKELSKINGPYYPLMRRGNWAVTGTLAVESPHVTSGSKEVKDDNGNVLDNVHDFTDQKKAEAYVQLQKGVYTTLESRWVDKTTGERYVTDANGNRVRVTSQDANAEQRFRVTIQNKHLEFVESRNEALRLAKELEDGGLTKVDTQERRFEQGAGADLQSWQMRRLASTIERSKGYAGLPKLEKNNLVQAFNIASLHMLGATRIQNSRLPRRNVKGASTNWTQNVQDYARSSGGYMAKLDHQVELDNAMKEMRDTVGRDYGKPEASTSRSTVANEIERRVSEGNAYEGSKLSPVINRVLAWSFIDKLASVSYSVMNATQVGMLTYPVLAARHGPGRAFNEILKAYRDVGAGGIIAQGAKDTWSKARRPGEDTGNYLDNIKARLGTREVAMIDYLVERGVIDPDAGLELGNLIASHRRNTNLQKIGTKVDVGVSYLEGIARQMPKAVEALNRTVSALAAYRMEFIKNGGDHEAAMIHAQDTVNGTQFNYSQSNSAPVFNHPLARLAFQFKKFGFGIYQLLGQQVMRAIHNAEPGDRAEALKSLAYIGAAHVAMAGTLGLPTEPIKALLIGASTLGLTDYEWKDFERWQREAAANWLGAGVGEALTRGVTRAIPGGFGFDVSGRLGLDNLLTFQEPNSPSTEDASAWVANALGGAPWALGWEWAKGSQKLMSGDLVGAGELLVPIKAMSDIIKGYRIATEGKRTKAGRDSFSPYSLGEAAVRSIGFTPGREAEANEQGNQQFRAHKSMTDARSSFMQEWHAAKGADRARIWGRVETWNKAHTKDARITRAELDTYSKRRVTESKTNLYKGGQQVGKHDQGAYKQLESIYNAE